MKLASGCACGTLGKIFTDNNMTCCKNFCFLGSYLLSLFINIKSTIVGYFKEVITSRS